MGAVTLFSGIAFIWWTVVPNLQIASFHRAFKKVVTTQDPTYILDNPKLFTPNYTQPMVRYLFATLLVKGYGSEDRSISLKLMPFALQKLEESVSVSKPYLNTFINLGKLYEILGHTSGDPKIDETFSAKAGDYYEQALKIVPNQQTVIVAYSINLYNRGKIDSAIALLRASLDEDDRIPDLHYYLGQFLAYQHEKNIPEALKEIELSFNLGSDIDTKLSQQTYQKMLFYFYKIHDQENMVTVLSRLITLDARQAPMYTQIRDYILSKHSIPSLELNK